MNNLVSSIFCKIRSIFRFTLGKTSLEFKHAFSKSTFKTLPNVSQPTIRSSFVSRLVTGNRIPLNESYFRNAARFKNINRRFLINSGFSFAFIGICVRDENGFPDLLRQVNNQEKRSTWQNAFNIVKNHYFKLNEVREDVDSVEKIQFNEPISKGCNGVVYKGEILSKEQNQTSQKVAVKMLFNFDVESNSAMILNSFVKETIPFCGKFGDVEIKRKVISPHPNIVKILSVFASDVQLLTDYKKLYPAAIPRKFGGYGRNMTLFIVERLYDMSLKDYLEHVPSPKRKISLAMLAQLFDGVDFLHQNQVAHRDLKPDNILVKINDLDCLPWLVITDFGLASTSLKIPFPTDEITRGGNRALMAPEIINALPGKSSFLDYCRSDIWAIGTIAYELFGANNPFYRREKNDKKIDSSKYNQSDLPNFPWKCHLFNEFIYRVLSVDPSKRPSPSFCSLFCHLVLNMGAKNLESLALVRNDKIRESLIQQWWRSFVNNLILKTWNCAKKYDNHEHQLRVHFVSNVNVKQIISHMNECQSFA